VRSATTRAARANAMYMRATARAWVTGSSSPAVEMAKSMITAKSEVVEERRY
jgi:hypothetical protein